MDGSTVFSTVIGGILTILVAVIFYAIGSRDLRKTVEELERETAEIKRQNRIVLGYLERAGLIEVHRNPNDEILEPVNKAVSPSSHIH